jgi:hypothetical protein
MVAELLDDQPGAFPEGAQFPALPLNDGGIQKEHKVPDLLCVKSHLEIIIPLEPLLRCPKPGSRRLVCQEHRLL